jgi:lipoprotein-anchoring transpeptidase ErfK/SrfK
MFRSLRVWQLAAAALILLVVPATAAPKRPAAAHNLSLESVNAAEWRRGALSPALLLKLQVLLDRAHASPGEIDANRGENTRKAVAAFREIRGLGSGELLDERLWRTLADKDNEPVLVMYTIAEKDVAGPFIDEVPKDYREKAALKRLSYTSAQELLAEKFHMSEKLLRQLNSDAAFERAGIQIVVANVQRALPRKVSRVEVDGSRQRVLAYDKDNRVIAIYPATVGSTERPSPSGEFKVTSVAENPTYHYDPALNLRGVDVDAPLDLPPGPNNPVGLVWIALSAKGYGIHGTPDPNTVSKRSSHGCVRLTNWDALELARHVSSNGRYYLSAPARTAGATELKHAGRTSEPLAGLVQITQTDDGSH